MTDRHGIPPEVRKLIDELLDGTISASEVRRLENALEGNHEAQQFFRNYCQLHINLDAETRTQRVVNDFKDRESSDVRSSPAISAPLAPSDSTAAEATQSPPALSFIADIFRAGVDYASRPAISFSVVLGSFVAVLLVSVIVLSPRRQAANKPPELAVNAAEVGNGASRRAEEGDRGGEPDAVAAAEFVARITDSHDVHWENPAFLSASQQRLWIGQELKLVEGLVEISFDVGAKVLMEGPAALTIDSRTQATLAYGQLTALVSEEAIGFTIETPMVNVVDLGTEFGVRVSPKGMTDVAVFSGKVVAAPHKKDNVASEPVSVVADEVRRFWNGSIKDEEPLAAPNFSLSIPREIPLKNASFELPRVDGWLAREITGWTIGSQPEWPGRHNGGVQLANAERVQLPKPAEGQQWGFIETRKAVGGGVHHTNIYQPVGKLAPSTLYRLKLTVGYEAYTTHGSPAVYPFSWGGQEGFEVGLWSGADENGQPLQPLTVARNPVSKLLPGSSEVVTLTYRTPPILPPGEEMLFVRLSLATNDWCRVLFDDVHLEAVTMGNNWTVQN